MVEVHPELVFAHLHGAAIPCSKRTAAGQAHRLECLQRVWGEVLPDPVQARVAFGRRNVAVDDILDACVLAHAARRIVLGQGQRLPPGVPPRDARGLRMEIWF
jgi:predicted RNase H-like nuclease